MLLMVFTTCKKKTDIEVKVYNPYIEEYVANATVVIVAKKGESGGGLFSGRASCSEIATATTDVNGIAHFDNQKLKTREGYKYFGVVKEAWGVTKSYPCGGYQGSYLDKGKSNSILLTEYTEGSINVQVNNMFNPAIAGDSIIFKSNRLAVYDPKFGGNIGEAFLFGIEEEYNASTSYPNVTIGNSTPLYGKIRVYIRKRKMGVVTTTIDTIKAYPNQTTTIQVNW